LERHDARTFGGLSNNLRLTLRELDLKPREKEKTPDLSDILAEHAIRKAPAP
jgi:hypothetical protein